jgi:hypothetical protein
LTGGSQWLCIPGEPYPKFARGKLHGPTCHRDRHYPWRIPCLMPKFARGKPPLPIPVGPWLSLHARTLIPLARSISLAYSLARSPSTHEPRSPASSSPPPKPKPEPPSAAPPQGTRRRRREDAPLPKSPASSLESRTSQEGGRTAAEILPVFPDLSPSC